MIQGGQPGMSFRDEGARLRHTLDIVFDDFVSDL